MVYIDGCRPGQSDGIDIYYLLQSSVYLHKRLICDITQVSLITRCTTDEQIILFPECMKAISEHARKKYSVT
jgi:hypothetical protein